MKPCEKCEQVHDPQDECPIVSDPDDRLDLMVSQASVPSLAALITRGKAAGLIKAQQDYTS